MAILGYSFEDNFYGTDAAAQQELLEAITESIQTKVYADPEMEHVSDDERQEAVSMSFDGTLRQGSPWGEMSFWDNLVTIMQHCPYTLDIVQIDSETSTPAEISEIRQALDIDPVDD